MNAITDTILQHQDSDLYFTFKATGDPDAGFVVTSFRACERVSHLYEVEIELASRRSDIDPADIIDRPGQLTIHDRYGEPRHYHGLVETIEQGDVGDRFTAYRIRLMPKLTRATHVTNCKIYQKQNIVAIIQSILDKHRVADVRFDLRETHPEREYCVQYRESDFAFIARLLAEEGAFFSFQHFDGRHVLVIADMSRTAPDAPSTSSIQYNAAPGGDVKGPYLKSFTRKHQVRSSKVAMREASFRLPRYPFDASHDSGKPNGQVADLEHYDYPGRYKADRVGSDYARYRQEHHSSNAANSRAAGRFAHAGAGTIFALTEHPAPALNARYFLTEVTQQGRQPTALEEDAGSEARADGGGVFLTTEIAQQSVDLPFRTQQLVKPLINGVQIATVVGPPGEEIYTDENSRVRLMFRWDRDAKGDDTSSCWIRVAQNWGGGQWGHIAIPRIGQSVLVAFTEGDPDQPLIIGRTYNADHVTPYQLPHHKTKMAIRSQTHKGAGFNEMSMEDEKGQENLFLHAQKDMTSKVLNNQVHAVDASGFHSYGQQHQLTIGANMNHQVGGGMNQVIGASTGAGAAALMSGALGGLMGQSAGMLQQAMSIASQAAAGQSGDAASKTAGAAMGAVASAATGGLPAGGGQPPSGGASSPAPDAAANAHGAPIAAPNAPPPDAAGQSTAADSHAGNLAGGAMGAASSLFDKAFSSATSAAPNAMIAAGGAPMASAGSSLLGQLGSMVGGGVLNQLIGMMHNKNVGVASTEQIGTAKVSTVGKVFKQKVGHTYHIDVGDLFEIGVGGGKDKSGKQQPPKAIIAMKKDGSILIKGVKIYVEGDSLIQHWAPIVHNN
jgi:type VI secretion system secreted protein VgrG